MEQTEHRMVRVGDQVRGFGEDKTVYHTVCGIPFGRPRVVIDDKTLDFSRHRLRLDQFQGDVGYFTFVGEASTNKKATNSFDVTIPWRGQVQTFKVRAGTGGAARTKAVALLAKQLNLQVAALNAALTRERAVIEVKGTYE